MDRVEIIWADSISFANDWIDKSEVRKLVGRECRTRGFLVHQDKDFIRVAQNVFGESFYNIMLIPAGAVKEIKRED